MKSQLEHKRQQQCQQKQQHSHSHFDPCSCCDCHNLTIRVFNYQTQNLYPSPVPQPLKTMLHQPASQVPVCVCHIRSTCSSRQANKWKTIVSEKNFLSEFLIRSDQKVCFFAAIVRCTRTYKIWPPDHCHPHLQAKHTIRNTL